MELSVGVWLTVLALGLIYSFKFSYRDAFGRPLRFASVIFALRLGELCTSRYRTPAGVSPPLVSVFRGCVAREFPGATARAATSLSC